MLTYERYAELRDAKGLTDYKMSLLTGMAKTTFSMWKRRNTPPSFETQLRIAKVLKLPVKEIVTREDIKSVRLPGEENG